MPLSTLEYPSRVGYLFFLAVYFMAWIIIYYNTEIKSNIK